jgi:phosphonate transport system substrate-binding protein
MAHAALGLLLAQLLAPGGHGQAGTAPPGELRVGVTPVLVEKHLDLNRQFVAYLGEKLGVPATLVQRGSYQEMSDLLEAGDLDVSFSCGLPYVIDHQRFGVELLAAPEVYDGPIYYSYVIVAADGPFQSFEALRGMRYAFSDPLSNSGWLVPAHQLARRGTTPEAFFGRTIFTYSHSESIEAVAVKFVDGASVDSYVYDYLAMARPSLVARTRVVERSGAHPIPPLVVRAGLPVALKARLRAALLEMDRDDRGRVILAGLRFKRFLPVSDAAFDGIRAMHEFVASRTGTPAAPRRGTRP